jgi:hypothetical protein
LNKWNQFKRYLFSDSNKNLWLKRIYFFLIGLNFKCEVFGTGADAFVLKDFCQEYDFLGSTTGSHILFLAGDLNLNNEKVQTQLKDKIGQLRFPRFVFIFGAIAGQEVTKVSLKDFKGDFFIPGGNYIQENLHELKKCVLSAVALHPEKCQAKYDQME